MHMTTSIPYFVYISQQAFVKLSILLRYIKKVFLLLLLLRMAAAAAAVDNRATSQMWTPFNQFGSVGFVVLKSAQPVNTYNHLFDEYSAGFFSLFALDDFTSCVFWSKKETICQKNNKKKTDERCIHKFHWNETKKRLFACLNEWIFV